ncbi:MFS transporter small subunit [Hymenobacter sublimis]|uniref:Oxalate:formate antiporter n=1 Tax=Hymenobacter sublimis TaxID=2933777 RepID=A0ABY4J7U4_9BACT|nr:hypothetical protein [Hymenobacter sublimis]UPL48883.1 hypothetical protein MWH26_17055 [Hymenobacter sublimis]
MEPTVNRTATPEPSSGAALGIAWLFVGIPLAWGVAQTFIKALALFK